jgi:hypothetical protein
MSTFHVAPPAHEVEARLFARITRVISITLFTSGLLVLVNDGLPTAYSLQTEPVQTVCFALMLVGFALASRRPMVGGMVTLVAWLGDVLEMHAHTTAIATVLLVAALLNVLSGWLERRAGESRT